MTANKEQRRLIKEEKKEAKRLKHIVNKEKQKNLPRIFFEYLTGAMIDNLDNLFHDGNPDHYPGGVDLNYVERVSEAEARSMMESSGVKFVLGEHYPKPEQIIFAKARKKLQRLRQTEIH